MVATMQQKHRSPKDYMDMYADCWGVPAAKSVTAGSAPMSINEVFALHKVSFLASS
jgi:hypothetical protein